MKITDEMVEKAFNAADTYPSGSPTWTSIEAAINAVAPLIRAAALEEAARVAEIEGERQYGIYGERDPESVGDDIATAIRALKDTPAEGDKT